MSTTYYGHEKFSTLSLYDQSRSGQSVVEDDSEIIVNPRALQNDFICVICLGILRRTMTTKDCLHRFCYDCINTAIRSGNKECPTCRSKLISKRDLRPDLTFDMLINTLFPEDKKNQYEEYEQKVLEEIHKSQDIFQGSMIKNAKEREDESLVGKRRRSKNNKSEDGGQQQRKRVGRSKNLKDENDEDVKIGGEHSLRNKLGKNSRETDCNNDQEDTEIKIINFGKDLKKKLKSVTGDSNKEIKVRKYTNTKTRKDTLLKDNGEINENDILTNQTLRNNRLSSLCSEIRLDNLEVNKNNILNGKKIEKKFCKNVEKEIMEEPSCNISAEDVTVQKKMTMLTIGRKREKNIETKQLKKNKNKKNTDEAYHKKLRPTTTTSTVVTGSSTLRRQNSKSRSISR